MKVTDLDYYMDGGLVKWMDEVVIKRYQKGWDNLIIVDGEERQGKSTFARTLAYYYAYKTGKKFTVDNVFFRSQDVLEFASTHKEEIIIWDESAFGGMKAQWRSQIQQDICTMLMVAGKYKHFFIFIIPLFWKLPDYIAIARAHTLFNLPNVDYVSRGVFKCYNRSQKAWLYNNNRKTYTYGKGQSFLGQFVEKGTEKILDLEAYEAKKDAAILEFMKQTQNRKKDKLELLQYKIATRLTKEQAMKLANVSDETIRLWGKLGGGSVLEPKNTLQYNNLTQNEGEISDGQG